MEAAGVEAEAAESAASPAWSSRGRLGGRVHWLTRAVVRLDVPIPLPDAPREYRQGRAGLGEPYRLFQKRLTSTPKKLAVTGVGC